MKTIYPIALGILSLSINACATHDRLFFIEKTHFGLRAELEPESQTPGNVHFGYKRSIATLIPCINLKIVPDEEGNKKEYCGSDNDQSEVDNNILSVISSFKTRVTWFEGTRVQTFFATGEAATHTAKDADAIKALVKFPKPI